MDPPASIRVEGTVKGDSLDDGVCIVGMACHLPGGIMSPSALWDFLMAGKSAQGPVPPERYNVAGFFRSAEDGGSTRPGVMPVSGGYFLQHDVRKLDNNFFGISNLECTYMDPQQRKLLEVVFQCFEHAGVTLDQVSGTSTGVYVGSFTVDYQTMQTREPDTMHRFTATGAGTTILANRISHVFNLHGPSMSIDTACSSSLYALHHAASAIKLGDCDSAVVAGVNLILGPEQMLGTSKAGVLSPTSTCHTFDAAADGYGRGEGVNAVLLKRLSAARRDGDKIWAVIRGSAVNANGATPGITQPSSDLQEEVIRKAYANAKLDPAATPYVECHGTGTPVGDPIEVEAVSRCFSRPVGMPALLIGSSKPNLGHSEAASGLTAVIKMAMALDRQEIPPTIGVKNINPNLKLDSRNIKVLGEGSKWPSQSRDTRRVSINSFGYGGANAHVILESPDGCDPGEVFRRTPGSHSDTNGASHHPVDALYPESCAPFSMSKGPHDDQNAATVTGPVTKIYAVPVSAASPQSLQDRVRQTKDILSSSRENLEELVLALGEKRTHFQGARDVILIDAGFAPGVDSTVQPREIRFIEHGISQNAGNTSSSSGNPALEGTSEFVFVFTGQGAQYPGMARELMLLNQDMAAASNATNATKSASLSVFRSTIRFLDSVLYGLPKTQAPAWTIEQTLLDTDPDISLRIHDVTRSQPVTTAIQIALVDMLASWGVRPSKVVGHSSGEIAAAYAAGLLSAEEAIMVAYLRGYAVGTVKQETAGAMLAAGIGIETAEGLIRDLGLTELVTIGCVNSPQSVTLSGLKEGIETLSRELEGRGTFSRVLRTDGRAYHSSMMRAAAELYEELLAPILRLGAGVEKVSEPHAGTMISTSSCLPDLESPSSRKMVSVDRQMASSAKYWRSNLEQPVQFQAATEQILTSSAKSQWVEIGPHPVLKGPIEQTRAGRDNAEGRKTQPWTYMGTLRRKEDARFATKTLAGSLFLRGYSLRWPCVNDMDLQNHHGMMAPDVHTLLPMYPWDYSEGILWHEPRASAETRARNYPCHELLGSRQVAGNEINFSWRKVLQLQGEAAWLRDHKVGSQIVFPAAGYLAMIIEAFNQIAATLPEGQVHDLGPRPGVEAVEFRDVKISSALVIPDGEGWNQGERIELHTQISRRMLSASTFSDHWYDFTISSLIWTGASASGSTLHCAGRIRSTPRTTGLARVTSLQNALSMDMKDWATWPDNAGWYDEMEQEGLCYGPSFRVIKKVQSPRTKTRTGESISRTGPVSSHLVQSGQYYPVHPIQLDACLQTAMLSSCAGDPRSIWAYLPEAIDRCLVRLPANHAKCHGTADFGRGSNQTGEAILYSRVMGTGVSTARLDCVLVDAVPRGTGAQSPIIEFQSVRITEYSAKVKTDPIASFHPGQDGRDATHARHPRLPRQPCLRIVWKPDISYVPHEELNNSVSGASSTMTEVQVATAEGKSGDAFADHIASFVRVYGKLEKEGQAGKSCSEGVRCPEGGLKGDATFIAALGGIIDLAGHKNPHMRVLEITDVLTYNTKAMEKSLHGGIGEEKGPPKVDDNPGRNWWLSRILGRDSGFQRYKEWRVGRLILSSDEGGKGDELGLGLEFSDNGQDNKNKQTYDLILFPNPVAGWQKLFFADPRDADDGDPDKYPILRLVARGGLVIGASSSADGGVSLLRPRYFGQAGLPAPSSGNKTLLLAEEKVTDDDNLEFFNFIILTREEAANVTHAASFAFIRVFMEHVSCAFGQRATVETVPFNSEAPSRINPPSHAARVVCISLLEFEQQFLASMAQPELSTLQEILDSVGSLLWVTGADMLSATGDMNPDLTLSSGLCRSLAIEQPTLGFTVVDIGDALHQIRTTLASGEKDEYTSAAGKSHKSLFSAARAIVDIARRRAEDNVEKELIWHQGRLHISRFVPDSSDINAIFCRRLGIPSPECPIIQPTSLSSACRQSGPLSTASAKLALARGAGIIEGLHYEQIVEPNLKPAMLLPAISTTPTVTIQVLAVGLNAQDVYSLHGRVESTPPDPRHQGTPGMLDYTGVITSVSCREQCELQIGDRVLVGVYSTPFATTVSEIPASAVHKLLPRENAAELATLPLVYATALYGLRDIGRVRPEQDTILIHCGAGSLGIAALTIAARVLGVHPTRMFATAGTEPKRRYIVETFGLPRENVMDSRDMASFVEGIKIQTGGTGVDVILNSLAGDLMHAGWESCLAPFGRFIEVGKRDLVDAGRLDMRVLEKGASFSAFDMAVLGLWRPDSSDKGGPGTGTGRALLRNLIDETLGLYRQGAITAIPNTIFQADEIAKAYRNFSSPERVGKVVISFENDKVSVPLALSRYWSVLDPEKVYLIVGGLGGLGRSLSRWMVSRGARNFVFLGRTGCDKPNAEQMVRELRESVLGVRVHVVRGDVASPSHVEDAMAACRATGCALGGVIQAAMALQESLFSHMSADSWQTAVFPKWAGTWNLHNALSALPHSDEEKADGFFFLLLSSVSGSVGTATESNYCAANGFLDAFAKWRRSQGRPATSIGLGMISEVGYLHENPQIEALLLRRGIQPLKESEFLQIMDLALSQPLPSATPSSFEPDLEAVTMKGWAAAHLLTGLEPFETLRLQKEGFDVRLEVMNDPRASILAAAMEQASAAATSSKRPLGETTSTKDFAPWFASLLLSSQNRKAMDALMTEADASSLHVAVSSLVLRRFATLMLTPIAKVAVDRPLARFGVDSMTAAEFRTWFWNSLHTDVPFLDLMSPRKSLADIVCFVVRELEASSSAGS